MTVHNFNLGREKNRTLLEKVPSMVSVGLLYLLNWDPDELGDAPRIESCHQGN